MISISPCMVILHWYEGQDKVDLSDYVNSGTWNIMSCPGVYNYTYDKAEGYHKAQITFTLQLRRKTLFYTVNLIIPCVLISFLSVSVFYLPADAGEKMTMCISILLALIVFLLLVSKILPPTSVKIPLIAKYLLFTFIMNIITILITVIIINWNFKTPRTHRMPAWVRYVFLNYLPRLLLMTRPHHAQRWSKKAYSRRNRPSLSPDIGAIRRRLQTMTSPSASPHSPLNCAAVGVTRRSGRAVQESTDSVPMLTASCDDLEEPRHNATTKGWTAETKSAIEAVTFIAAHLKNEDDYAEILDDWRYIAMVIDRLQLCIFLAVTITGTASILINAPHIFEFVDQDEIKRNIVGNSDDVSS